MQSFRTAHSRLSLFGIFLAGIFALTASISPASALSALQQGAISQHCGTITQSLSTLRRADSQTRIYLGSYYESLLKKFIIPLNIRLTKTNPDTYLMDLQNRFTDTRNNFSQQFIKYSQKLDELIAVDCRTNPASFYRSLGHVRAERQKLAEITAIMSGIIDEHIIAVQNLGASL